MGEDASDRTVRSLRRTWWAIGTLSVTLNLVVAAVFGFAFHNGAATSAWVLTAMITVLYFGSVHYILSVNDALRDRHAMDARMVALRQADCSLMMTLNDELRRDLERCRQDKTGRVADRNYWRDRTAHAEDAMRTVLDAVGTGEWEAVETAAVGLVEHMEWASGSDIA